LPRAARNVRFKNLPFNNDGYAANGRFRRALPAVLRPGKGPSTEPQAAAQPVRREPPFMPHISPLRRRHSPLEVSAVLPGSLARSEAFWPGLGRWVMG
jgi:hypothetical protein